VPVAAEAEPVSASAWGGFGEAPAWAVGLTVSVGAGIYEELLFRLILLTLLHIAFVDVIPLPAWAGTGVAVLASAVAFAQVHFDPVAAAPFQLGRWLFFVLAGVYLGYVFLFRGFGLAVGAHAMYDVMVVGLQMMQPHAE